MLNNRSSNLCPSIFQAKSGTLAKPKTHNHNAAPINRSACCCPVYVRWTDRRRATSHTSMDYVCSLSETPVRMELPSVMITSTPGEGLVMCPVRPLLQMLCTSTQQCYYSYNTTRPSKYYDTCNSGLWELAHTDIVVSSWVRLHSET